MTTCLSGTCFGLEAIAARLEAIASRVEAIADHAHKAKDITNHRFLPSKEKRKGLEQVSKSLKHFRTNENRQRSIEPKQLQLLFVSTP